MPSSVIRRELYRRDYDCENVIGSGFEPNFGSSVQMSVMENSPILDVKPVIVQIPVRAVVNGNQSVNFTPVMSENILVVTKPNGSISSPELASILKRVPSNSKVNRLSTASPNDVVSDSSGCVVEVDRESGKDRKDRKEKGKGSDKDESALSLASEGVTVETVDKSVNFKLRPKCIVNIDIWFHILRIKQCRQASMIHNNNNNKPANLL